MGRIRVGFIGAGANTRAKHIPGLKALPGVELAAVANRSVESARRVCREFEIGRAELTPERLLRAADIDAVVIGTWPYRHCAYAISALKHGKHVLTEARMAMDSREAARMLSASKNHRRLVAMVVPSPFTLPYDHAVKHFVETRLGKLLQVELCIHTGQFPSPLSELTWRHERRLSGNNTMAMGIYYEALERWIGPAATVAAMTRVVQGKRKDPTTGLPRAATVPDLVQVQGLMKRDRAFYRMSFSDASGFAKQSECILHGSEAALKIPFDGNLFYAARGESGIQKLDFTPGPGWRVEEEFIRAIRGEEKVYRTTFADGLSYMKWTDAVHASAKTSRVARIAP